jgi:predicted transcriptional regulator
MTGAIDRELGKYIGQLNAAQKRSLLGFIKTLIPSKKEGAISLEQYNKELEDAEQEINAGEFYTHEEVREILKKVVRGEK